LFTPDTKTLSLLVGIANLVFALLATLYLARTRTNNPALAVWRWARLLSGCGFLVNLASHAAPQWLSPVLGNCLQITAGGLDIAAYSLLLGHTDWRKPLLVFVGVSISIMVTLGLISDSQALRLIVFSLIGAVFYSVLSLMILRASAGDWLLKVIGLIDALLVTMLLLRVARGLALGSLVRFDTDVITLVLYLVVFLVVMINGFGFLLVAKQKDDAQLYRALDELEQSDQSRHQLLTQVSHEFRTPTAQIKASLDSLRFFADIIPPELAARLDNIRIAANRLHDLSNTLLTHDRLSDPSMASRKQSVDLTALMLEVSRHYPTDGRVRFELPAKLLPVSVDPVQIRIAVHNLIDNALEHNKPGTSPVVVTLRSAGPQIEVSVADAGQGIQLEQGDLFRRYGNGHGEFARGLGLSIVDRVARNHGGSVSAASNTPRGTIMTLSLPAQA